MRIFTSYKSFGFNYKSIFFKFDLPRLDNIFYKIYNLSLRVKNTIYNLKIILFFN